MGERLRGKGNYTVAEIMAFSSHEDDWRKLEALLYQDYVLVKSSLKIRTPKGGASIIALAINHYVISIQNEMPYSLLFKSAKMRLKRLSRNSVPMLSRYGKTDIPVVKVAGCGIV